MCLDDKFSAVLVTSKVLQFSRARFSHSRGGAEKRRAVTTQAACVAFPIANGKPAVNDSSDYGWKREGFGVFVYFRVRLIGGI